LADGLWVGGQYSDQGSESPFGALSTATIAAQCGIFYCISSVESRVLADSAATSDKLVSLVDEPKRSNPQSKVALRPTCAGVRGDVCGFAAAVADVGICARARAAVRTSRPGGRRLRAMMFLLSQVSEAKPGAPGREDSGFRIYRKAGPTIGIAKKGEDFPRCRMTKKEKPLCPTIDTSKSWRRVQTPGTLGGRNIDQSR